MGTERERGREVERDRRDRERDKDEIGEIDYTNIPSVNALALATG